MIPPRNPDEPEYTPAQRAEMAAAFLGARRVLERGYRSYICHALKLAAGTCREAQAVVLGRLGIDPTEDDHYTLVSWTIAHHGVRPIDATASRLLWLDDLIKEFTDGS
jgi:hypothetical protein